MRILLIYAFRQGEIDAVTGMVKKARLRHLLWRKVEDEELGVLDPDVLGRTLRAFHLLENLEPNTGFYKLNTERLARIVAEENGENCT